VFGPGGPTLLELAHQALSSTDRGYELLADKFDATPFRTPEWALDLLEPHFDRLGPVEVGLDVCCGTGAALARLVPHCRRAIGLDRVPAMLEVAARNLGDLGPPTPELVVGDALQLPFEGEIDLLTSSGAFGHIAEADEQRFAQSVFQALRPGGAFVFLTGLRPGPDRATWWVSRGFNAAMRVRNALIRPPFIMYYLTFLLPETARLLEEVGFVIEVHDPKLPRPRDLLRVVIATRPG
jgi:SAM-dependent methyltransferase